METPMFEYDVENDVFVITGLSDGNLYYNDYLETITSELHDDLVLPKNPASELSREGLILKVICTNRCNLRCKYCYSRNDKDNVLTFNILKSILNRISLKMPVNKIVFVGGGEPSIESDLIQNTVSYCQDRFADIQFSIQTNGTFDSTFLDFLLENNFDVVFSLDGPYSLVSSYQEGHYSEFLHKKIEDNIVKYTSRSKRYQINCVRFYNTNVSIASVDIVDYLYSLGVKQISLDVNYEHWLRDDIDIQELVDDFYSLIINKGRWKDLKLIIPLVKASSYSVFKSGKKCNSLYSDNHNKLTLLPNGLFSYCHREQQWNVSDSYISSEQPLYSTLPSEQQNRLTDFYQHSASECQACVARQICNILNCPFNAIRIGANLECYCNNLRLFRMGLISKYLI